VFSIVGKLPAYQTKPILLLMQQYYGMSPEPNAMILPISLLLISQVEVNYVSLVCQLLQKFISTFRAAVMITPSI
jgi:hypothetical protein